MRDIPVTIRIDGQDVPVLLHRLNRRESFDFRTALNGFRRRRARLDAALEALHAKDFEESTEEAEAIGDQIDRLEEQAEANMWATVEQFVRPDTTHGAPRLGDQDLTSTADLMTAIGGHFPTVRWLFDEINVANTFTEEGKNAYRSRFDSAGGSGTASPGRSGPRRGSTAGVASGSDSKKAGDA